MTKPWRSLAEAAANDDADLLRRLKTAYPSLSPLLADDHDRRSVLRLMAASLAMGGLSGCGPSVETGKIVPAVIQPPDIVPGLPNFYATAVTSGGYAEGIVVRHQDGRPIKIDGNPHHPASLGATDAIAQAQVLAFYDPYRDQGLQLQGQPVGWDSFLAAINKARMQWGGGERVRLLSGTVTSPTLARQIADFLSRYPHAKWSQWEATSRDNVVQGAHLAYGAPVDVIPMLDQADVILAIESDLLSAAPGHLSHARAWAKGRNPARLDGERQRMTRLYAVEATPTLAGAAADHRFIASPAEQRIILNGLATAFLGTTASAVPPPVWLAAVIDDLRTHHGRALIHLGPYQTAEDQALMLAVNEALGARDKTMRVIERVTAGAANQLASLQDLLDEIAADRVDTLIMLDTNAVLTAPADFGFAAALKGLPLSIAVNQEFDETAALARWFVPSTHSFESWSDAKAFDGTVSIVQPQAVPIYGARSPHEILSVLLDDRQVDPAETVKQTWRARMGKDFDAVWRSSLSEGIVTGTKSNSLAITVVKPLQPPNDAEDVSAGLTILFRPDAHLWDGRHANNPWLQELPRALTKTVWDNPLLISPALARQHQLKNGDCVRLRTAAGEVKAPVYVVPGQSVNCITAHLGFGRGVTGPVGKGTGFDFYPLRQSDGLHEASVTVFEKLPDEYRIATTEHHSPLDGDPADAIRHMNYAAFLQTPEMLHNEQPTASLYPPVPAAETAWGMSIDLNSCIGCNACVVACQAENNIPVVGKQEVLREREMHWLRIDRYYEGPPDAPDSYFQPVLCMHCENAPCEVVCPVGATNHDDEGLNVMVYNRCVGTRFCSNNCPYKVRRFNYFAYAKEEMRPPDSRNDDVTVRARGVMEKCTFCVQRIAAARIDFDKSDGKTPETVVTACQAACPTQAFTFGNINDADSVVAARKRSPLSYSLLAERNTRPRVTYEGLVRNPNPAVEKNSA